MFQISLHCFQMNPEKNNAILLGKHLSWFTQIVFKQTRVYLAFLESIDLSLWMPPFISNFDVYPIL